MNSKEKLRRKLRIAAGDKQDLDRQILRLHKCFKEVEKNINRSKINKK